MNKMKHYRRFLLLLAMLSAATFANAQNGTKDYKVSGIVPDGINKIYYSHRDWHLGVTSSCRDLVQ